MEPVLGGWVTGSSAMCHSIKSLVFTCEINMKPSLHLELSPILTTAAFVSNSVYSFYRQEVFGVVV